MKKCPTCDKTFDDGMRFCQTDGTPLVNVAESASQDPYKTTAASQDEIASAIPLDPFKTMVAPPPKKEEREVLEQPKEPDFLKTIVSSQDKNIKEPFGKEKEEKKDAPPPSPFNDVFSSSVAKPESSSDKFSAGNVGSSMETATPKFDSKPLPDESLSNQSSDEDQSSQPIPSPFDESMIGYQAPSKPMPPFKEPEPIPVGGKDPFTQSPFNQPPNTFGQQQVQQSDWTPPPAPDSSWQSQEIGQNTPFQPPVTGQGQNQTLAIVSLVLGILSIPCCGFIIFGIASVITGFMAKSRADQNPNEYGGRGLALGGIIIGAITIILGIIFNIVYWFIGLPMNY
ncbi:MAG: DUF4190 domain-containing protein [Pyrinomonadaceae bacterium]